MTENNDADTAITALLEFLNAVETGIANARQILKETKIGWIPDQIKWEQAEGSSGPYQLSEDVKNPEFKAMLKDLQAHGGRLTREGWFYWVFQNGTTVGRKKRNQTAKNH
ncbi:MAG: hypothetical protein QXF44_02765 [Candidatus Bathyarchaeia archaeon]